MPSWHAYYQIADAAERSVSPTLVGRALAQMPRRRPHERAGRNANSTKCKPSREPEPPSSRLGSALAIFSVAGATLAPPRWWGLFFVLSCCAFIRAFAERD